MRYLTNSCMYVKIPHMSDTHAGAGAAPKKRALVPNILAIVGCIILVIIIVWGLLHLASISGGLFSSSSKTGTAITVTAPATAVSGEPMQVSWKYAPKEKGSYALLYQCNTGVQFAAPNANQTFATVPCGAAYALGSATNTATLLPVLTATSSRKVNITIVHIPSATGGAQGQGHASVTVNPSNRPAPAPETPETPAQPTKPTTPTTPSTPGATGPADLSVRIVSVSVDAYGNGVATFDIANVGGSASGTYSFTAQLPTMQPYTYSSPAQAPLAPGSHVLSTLNFTQAAGGLFSVSVSGDANTGNNAASQYLSGGYNQYPQYPYAY